MSALEAGSSATAELIVGPADLASVVGLEADDRFPPVFATARLVALMEVAASRALRPVLQPGELSVGVAIDVAHTAATPEGVLVEATARFLHREGKLYVFEVIARDPGGEIGHGTHKRAVVTSDRLVSGAARRIGPA